MSETILMAKEREIVTLPRATWEGHLVGVPEHMKQRLAFMTEAHHRVRYFVVRELPKIGEAIPPETIAEQLDLSLEQVKTILDDLEKNLFFLFRNPEGAVLWAYPVTAAPTPHQLEFSTGEIIYAA